MKFSTACMVFAAFAAAAAPVRADPLVSSTLATLGDNFSRLIKTQTNIKTLEKRNVNFVSYALNGISRELHQGLHSDVFQIGNGIRNTLVDVNLKVGQISGHATSIISEFKSVAQTISTLQFSNARIDYSIKKSRIKKLCEDTLATTNVILRLIDDTRDMLSKGVNGPIKMLQLTVQLTSNNAVVREKANIAYQQSIIDNPPIKWSLLTDYDAVNTAQALKQKGSETIERINTLVTSILHHARWLESECQTIRKDLDNDRTSISVIETKIGAASVTISVIADRFDFLLADSQNMNDTQLKEGSKALVKLMKNLNEQVSNIRRDDVGKADDFYDYTTTETYNSAPDYFSPAVVHKQPGKQSWLDKTPVNRCYYIYNNGTTGCIFVQTFEYMKVQYTWLINKSIEIESLLKDKEKQWNDLETQKSVSIEALANWEIKKHMWSDKVKKIRDLSVQLNSYAERLFSDAQAQMNITGTNDDLLNQDIKRFIDDKKDSVLKIMEEILRIILS